MKMYKALVASLAVAGLLGASVASAQVADSANAVGVSGPDLGVSINDNGIVLDATNSSQPINVTGLPVTISGGMGGSCQLDSENGTLGTIDGSGSVSFANPIVVPAGSSATVGIMCSGANAGTYPISLATSRIPAMVENTNQAITPRNMDNSDTMVTGSIVIGNSGTLTGIGGEDYGSNDGSKDKNNKKVVKVPVFVPVPVPISNPVPVPVGSGPFPGGPGGPISSTAGTSAPQVLGASTGVPNIPNTGDGGAMAMNLAILAIASLVATGGAYALRRGLVR